MWRKYYAFAHLHLWSPLQVYLDSPHHLVVNYCNALFSAFDDYRTTTRQKCYGLSVNWGKVDLAMWHQIYNCCVDYSFASRSNIKCLLSPVNSLRFGLQILTRLSMQELAYSSGRVFILHEMLKVSTSGFLYGFPTRSETSIEVQDASNYLVFRKAFKFLLGFGVFGHEWWTAVISLGVLFVFTFLYYFICVTVYCCKS